MRIKTVAYALLILSALVSGGCQSKPAETDAGNQNRPVAQKTPGPLPERGFKAQITFSDPPAKLRAGQKEIIQLKAKNMSDVKWWVRGGEVNDRPDNKFFIAFGNRWLDKDGKLLTSMDGRIGFSKNLGPGEETEEPLQITAPKEPGEYILEVDLVQEQVSWFSDRGSPTARTKITVVK